MEQSCLGEQGLRTPDHKCSNAVWPCNTYLKYNSKHSLSLLLEPELWKACPIVAELYTWAETLFHFRSGWSQDLHHWRMSSGYTSTIIVCELNSRWEMLWKSGFRVRFKGLYSWTVEWMCLDSKDSLSIKTSTSILGLSSWCFLNI